MVMAIKFGAKSIGFEKSKSDILLRQTGRLSGLAALLDAA
jgi:hypothetical protein